MSRELRGESRLREIESLLWCLVGLFPERHQECARALAALQTTTANVERGGSGDASNAAPTPARAREKQDGLGDEVKGKCRSLRRLSIGLAEWLAERAEHCTNWYILDSQACRAYRAELSKGVDVDYEAPCPAIPGAYIISGLIRSQPQWRMSLVYPPDHEPCQSNPAVAIVVKDETQVPFGRDALSGDSYQVLRAEVQEAVSQLARSLARGRR